MRSFMMLGLCTGLRAISASFQEGLFHTFISVKNLKGEVMEGEDKLRKDLVDAYLTVDRRSYETSQWEYKLSFWRWNAYLLFWC